MNKQRNLRRTPTSFMSSNMCMLRVSVFVWAAAWVLLSSSAAAIDTSNQAENNSVITPVPDTASAPAPLDADSHSKERSGLAAGGEVKSNLTCDTDHHHSGIRLVSLRWHEVGVYYTITAFVIIAGLTKLGFHHLHWLANKVPESCVLVVLGVALGLLVFFTTHDTNPATTCHYHVELPHFTSDKFFFILLPPIVLESAYSLHDRAFFDNIGTVLVYAVVGTLFNIFAIGPTLYGASVLGAMGDINFTFTESLVFSSLISAVDPVAVLAIFQELGVNKDLYFLVFGESLLNDGVTVVMYNTMQAFLGMDVVSAGQYALAVAAFFIVVLGGIVTGITFGCLTALITKSTTDVRVVEPLALLGLSYLSYLTAELFHFSGIISLIVCGLVQAHYAFQNISQKSYTCVKYFTKMASATSDTIIFMFLGMVLVSDDHVWHTGFVLWSVMLCLVFRFLSVFIMTNVMNHYRVKKIGLEEQFIAAYGGLRGAVAFSLVNMLDESLEPRRIFITTTLVVILFTIFVQGMTIKPLVNLLHIQKRLSGRKNLSEEINNTAMDHIMAGVEEILGQHGDFYLRELMIYYNDKYLKKWFLRPSCESKLTRLFEKIAISEHYAHLYGPVAMIEDKVKPFCNSTKVKERVRTSSISPSHKDEALIQPGLTLEDEAEQDTDYVTSLQKDNDVQVRSKKRMSYLPVKRNRIASESSAEESSVQGSDDAQVLRKAFRNNPYNKLHFKYNPNLVGEENQELSEHLHRRHINARRMTRLASSKRLPTMPRSMSERQPPRPQTAVVGVALQEGAAQLVQRHQWRRNTMAGHLGSTPPLQTCFSSPEPGTANNSSPILKTLLEANESAASLPDMASQQVMKSSTATPSPEAQSSDGFFPESSAEEVTGVTRSPKSSTKSRDDADSSAKVKGSKKGTETDEEMLLFSPSDISQDEHDPLGDEAV